MTAPAHASRARSMPSPTGPREKGGYRGRVGAAGLRHMFVSVMSESGFAVEEIARLPAFPFEDGRDDLPSRTAPVIITGADVMDKIPI